MLIMGLQSHNAFVLETLTKCENIKNKDLVLIEVHSEMNK